MDEAHRVSIGTYAIELSENDEPLLTFTLTFEGDPPDLTDNATVKVTAPAHALAPVYAVAFGAAVAQELPDKLRDYRGAGSYSGGS